MLLQEPQILVNGEKIKNRNIMRTSIHVFEFSVDKNQANFVSARMLSTHKKHNGEVSKAVECL